MDYKNCKNQCLAHETNKLPSSLEMWICGIFFKVSFRFVFNWVHQHFHTIKWIKYLWHPPSRHTARGFRSLGSESFHRDIQIRLHGGGPRRPRELFFVYSLLTVQMKAPSQKTIKAHTSLCVCTCVCCAWRRYSNCVGVVGSKCMKVAQLTKATLDVCHVDLNIILEATGNIEKMMLKKCSVLWEWLNDDW